MKRNIIIGIIITLTLLIIMGLLSIFSSKSNQDKKYVTEDTFRNNYNNQVKMTPETLKQLRDAGVTETKELKLEYFFYTNSLEKARNLAEEIQKMNYSVKFQASAYNKKEFVITGWTDKMKMNEPIVIEWTKKMCELGYKFDCEFDGWGTEPDQE